MVVFGLGPVMSLEFPRAFQKSENWGGVGCFSNLVLLRWPQWGSPGRVLQTAGTPCLQQRTELH